MTTSAAEIQRKVRQLENDINEIYDMLSAIRKQVSKQGAHLAEFEVRVDERFDALEGRFDALERELGAKIDGLADLIRQR